MHCPKMHIHVAPNKQTNGYACFKFPSNQPIFLSYFNGGSTNHGTAIFYAYFCW